MYVTSVDPNLKGCDSPVFKVSEHGKHVMISSQVPLKTRRVGKRSTLNLSRFEMSSRWCGVLVRRWECQLRCRQRHLTMVQNYMEEDDEEEKEEEEKKEIKEHFEESVD
ncbi:uncharacterized protein TNCV_1151741 [Trichonephila clavipes]|nr:uncharacterized protein TNCV_1151741 [Trichonephila clavipes]